MMIPQAISPVNWLHRAVSTARQVVAWPEMSDAAPLVRPCLTELAQPGAALPPFVAESSLARRYLDLLGPLDWAHFPDRKSVV